jgi:Tol biopolymer transport system component
VLAAALLAAAALPAAAAKDDLILVSRATGVAGPGGDASSGSPAVSADGRFVAFQSQARNLSSEDDDAAVSNVFVRDTLANRTTLVSRATGATGAGGDNSSLIPSISADGRFVAFVSGATNLSGEDDDTVSNVFVRDTVANTTTLVSRATGAAGAGGDGDSFGLSISADGRFVAFDSEADNLSGEDDDAVSNVFVRDTLANTTTLVSRATGAGGAGGDSLSRSPSISADGRFVAFISGADNLSGEDDNDVLANVFVRDTLANTTTLVSRATGAAGAGGDDFSSELEPSISADGRFVAFESRAKNFSDADSDAVADVFVRDTLAGTTTLVSRATGPTGAGGSGHSVDASISGDGRFVAFSSPSDNLSGEDQDGVTDVFERDVLGSPPPPPPPPPPPAPPPGLQITGATATATWQRSRATGSVRVRGSAGRAARIELALLSGRRVVARKVFDVKAGAFDLRLALPRTILPGAYSVRLRELGTVGIAALPERGALVRVAPPPEGVVRRAVIARARRGPAVLSLRSVTRIWASFSFAARPLGRRVITVTWLKDGKALARPEPRRLAGTIESSLGNGGETIPPGSYRCVLRSGKTVVAVAAVRIRLDRRRRAASPHRDGAGLAA